MVESSEYRALELSEIEHLPRGAILDDPVLVGIGVAIVGTSVLCHPANADQTVGVVHADQSRHTLYDGGSTVLTISKLRHLKDSMDSVTREEMY